MTKKSMCVISGSLLLTLVGCGGNGAGPDSEIEPAVNELEAIFAADPEGDSVNILDSAGLGVSIDRRFGDESAEAISIAPDDTIGDVLDRADNG